MKRKELAKHFELKKNIGLHDLYKKHFRVISQGQFI